MSLRRFINPGLGLSAWALAGRNAAGYKYGATVTGQGDRPRQPGHLERYFDANREGQGIWKWRHYFPAYERHLARFRSTAPTILEIGLYSGGSIGMWRDYLGAGTRIIGLDIEEACRAYEAADVTIHVGDQGNPAFWNTLDLPPLDIVIDDGGHEYDQQTVTLQALLPKLKPGGVYICEDVAGTENPFQAYVAGMARHLNQFGEPTGEYQRDPHPFQQAVDSVHFYPYLTVIERRAEPLTELAAERHGTVWQPFYRPNQTPAVR